MSFGLTLITISYIIFLVVPGIFFKRFYFQSKFQNDFYKGSFADKIITSIFWGLFIQIIAFCIFMWIFDFSIDQIHHRANNVYIDLHSNTLPKLSPKQLSYLLCLFTLSLTLACFIGHIFHKGIRFARFDRKFSPLRFSNEWHYTIRNELGEQKISRTSTYLSTEVDILINEVKDGQPVFYTGVLRDYHLNSEGQLDRLCLEEAKKRLKEPNAVFQEIMGDRLVVPYCNIANLNLRFNYIKRESGFKIPTAIRNIGSLLYFGVLLIIFIAPWFAFVGVFLKILSIVFFSFSWLLILAIFGDLSNSKRQLAYSTYLFCFCSAFILTLVGLDMLDIFKAVSYAFSFIGNIGR